MKCEINLIKHSHVCIFKLREQVQAQIVAGEPISDAAWNVPGDLASQSSDFQINFTPAVQHHRLSLHYYPLAPPISANHVSDNRYTRHLNHSSYTPNNTPTPPTYTVANRKHG